MQEAIEKFAIFGGVEWGEIDTSLNSFELIKKLILNDYRYIRNDITELTGGAPLHHSILSAIAMGDGKTHSVYKRANVTQDIAQRAIDELCETKIIKVIRPIDKSMDEKLMFTTPFLKFWFAFVSPLFKGIKEEKYDEVKTRWENREIKFIEDTFCDLSRELVRAIFKDERIMSVSSYWSKQNTLDIYATTKSKDIIIGNSKYTNSKMKKSELTKLKEISEEEGIDTTTYVLISKSGFSSELKTLKSDKIKLLTIKHFQILIK